VAGHQEGTLVGGEGLGQLAGAGQVQVVGRLVQQVQLRGWFGEQAPPADLRPFVMNTGEELLQAFEDDQAGRLGTIPAAPRPGHEALKETTEPR
jgi:hypothetical protein